MDTFPPPSPTSLEKERKKLHAVVKKHGHLGHPEVIKQSMRLDELINTHQQYRYGKPPLK